MFISPSSRGVSEPFDEKVGKVESGLVEHGLPGLFVELIAQVLNLSSCVLCCLACVFNLNSFSNGRVLEAPVVMKLHEFVIDPHSGEEDELSNRVKAILFEAVEEGEVILVGIHFFLRLNMSEFAGEGPPFLRGLDDHSVGLHLLDEFLSPKSEHVGDIHCSNEEDFSACEGLGQMNEG